MQWIDRETQKREQEYEAKRKNELDEEERLRRSLHAQQHAAMQHFEAKGG